MVERGNTKIVLSDECANGFVFSNQLKIPSTSILSAPSWNTLSRVISIMESVSRTCRPEPTDCCCGCCGCCGCGGAALDTSERGGRQEMVRDMREVMRKIIAGLARVHKIRGEVDRTGEL